MLKKEQSQIYIQRRNLLVKLAKLTHVNSATWKWVLMDVYIKSDIKHDVSTFHCFYFLKERWQLN